MAASRTRRIEPTTCKCGRLVMATVCPHCGLEEFAVWGPCGRHGCFYCGETREVLGCHLGQCSTCTVEVGMCPLLGMDLEILDDAGAAVSAN